MNYPDSLPTLETERLVLREVGERDAGALFAIHANPEAMRYWSRPPMVDVAEARAMIERWRGCFANREALTWGIALRKDDSLIGTHTLFQFHEQNRRCEIGYILAPEHWGHGYMREALATLVGYAFNALDLHRIEADTDPRNAASVRVLEHLGFAREGLLRERWCVAGEVSDSLLLGLLRSDWERRPRTL